jgi:alkylation response protein AidB-like acyl-CoA dehydrogenase
MDLDLSDEQRELEDSTRDVLSREHTVELARRVVEQREGAGKEVDDLWTRMVSLDWPALTVPEANGGLGLGAVELAVVSEQLGHALAPGPFLSTASQFVAAVRDAGSAAQQRAFLDPIAKEGAAGTLAFAEESGSFDLAGVHATFRPAPEAAPAPAGAASQSGGFVLDGVKSFVLEATRARNIVVVARSVGSTGASGIGMFVVPSDSEGLSIKPMTELDATRELATVALDGVSVPAENVLSTQGGVDGPAGPAGPDEAAEVLSAVLEEATVMIAAEMVGTCQRIVDVILEHAMTREQFGVKIGSFQAMKHKLANMYVAVESARATVRYAAAAIAEGDPRRTLAASMAKASAGDCERLVGVEGIQCLGGIGYTWEHDMHLYVKRIRTAAALLGTAAQHRVKVGELIGLSAS